jgi:hypothetical protein
MTPEECVALRPGDSIAYEGIYTVTSNDGISKIGVALITEETGRIKYEHLDLTPEECVALKPGDIVAYNGVYTVTSNDGISEIGVALVKEESGRIEYDDLGDASKLAPRGGGGGTAPPSGDYVAKTGDTMSGPLAIATDTLPELHITSVAGDFSLDLSSGELKFSRTADATGLTMTTYGYSARGSSGEGGNKTDLGLNYIGIANKSYQSGGQIIGLLQQSNGELALTRGGGSQIYLTDFANGRLAIPVSSDVGNTLTWGTDNKLFTPTPTPTPPPDLSSYVTEAPIDSTPYCRQDAGWVAIPPPVSTDLSSYVQKAGDNMSGTLSIDGSMGATLSVMSGGQNSTVSISSVDVNDTNVTPSKNVSIRPNSLLLVEESQTELKVDRATGDIIATPLMGPHFGKTRNLTDFASIPVTRATVKELVREVLRELLAI